MFNIVNKLTEYANSKEDATVLQPKVKLKGNHIIIILFMVGIIVISYTFRYMIPSISSGDNIDSFIYDSEIYKSKKLPSGADYFVSSLKRDKAHYYTLCEICPLLNDNLYGWGTGDLDTIKADMKYMANVVFDYAQYRKWDNNFYLIIQAGSVYCPFLYDYETDQLFYPDNYNVMKFMYKQFGTGDPNDLLGSESGERFLINNHLAQSKHNQTELALEFYLDGAWMSDGKFSQNLEHYIKY